MYAPGVLGQGCPGCQPKARWVGVGAVSSPAVSPPALQAREGCPSRTPASLG